MEERMKTYFVSRKGQQIASQEAYEKWLVASKCKKNNEEMMIRDNNDITWYALIKASKQFEKTNINYFALYTGDGRCIKTTENVYTARSWTKQTARDQFCEQYLQIAHEGYVLVKLQSNNELCRFYFN